MGRMALSPHQMNRLSLACIPIREAFDCPPYLVGSALTDREYRDVDVRLILDDEHYDRLGFGPPGTDGASHDDPLWALLNAAISEWLSGLSGLPIDFQIQRRTEANRGHREPERVRHMHDEPIIGCRCAEHPSNVAPARVKPRSALGVLGVWEHSCAEASATGAGE